MIKKLIALVFMASVLLPAPMATAQAVEQTVGDSACYEQNGEDGFVYEVCFTYMGGGHWRITATNTGNRWHNV